MAIAIFHKVINKVTIINKDNKEDKKKEQKTLNAKLRLNKHTRSEVKAYD